MWRDWLRLGGPVVLVVGGLACIVIATQTNLEAHTIRRDYVESGAAQRAAEAVAQPAPIWLPDDAEPVPSGTTSAQSHPSDALDSISGIDFTHSDAGLVAGVPRSGAASAPSNSSDPLNSISGIDFTQSDTRLVAGGPTAALSPIELIDAGFMFLDPPQPGARARFWLNLRVLGGQSSGPIALAIPLAWFDGYRLASTTPSASLDASTADGQRRLVFGALAPGAATLQVDVISIAELLAPPTVRVELAVSGARIGEAHPRTVAPKPRPGPISALRIPRLGLNVAVVPTDWEPPAFVAGQLRGSADVSKGNSVLVGHLTGAAGAVFNHLDELAPGDTVVVVSRGLEYTFVVSDKQLLPADDSRPAAPDVRPRLTLMTCSGTWDPLARNYSDRLWVTAEPPDIAAATIAEGAAHPPDGAGRDADVLASGVLSSNAMPPSASEPPAVAVPDPRPANAAPDLRPPVAAPDLRQAVAAPDLKPGGLGATRASFDAAYGPPLGETPDHLVVYRRGAAEYHVRFSSDPARAERIELLSVGTGTNLTLSAAVQHALALFPPDAHPRTRGPEAAGDMIVERYDSPMLHQVLGPYPDTATAAFLAGYAFDRSGVITRVVVEVGDTPHH